MSASLLGPAAPAFDEPLEMLDACHGRIEAQLKTLERLVEHLPRHGVDAAARQAIEGVVRYFTVAAPHHHEDEEADLFPALHAAVAGRTGEDDEVAALVTRLLADHRRMDVARDAMLDHLGKLLAGGAADLSAESVAALAALYREHIALETEQLLPLAKRVLPAAVARGLGERMAARRGAPMPG